MKKVIALVLVAMMVIGAMTGCAKKAEPAKTGLAVISSIEKSKSASAEGDGVGQVDSLVVAVLVDGDGKILDCQIDQAQTKINFSVEGKITSDVTAAYKSKQELKDEYGMKGNSSIGKEWYEQADAFAKYVVGKTVADVKGIAVNEEGAPSDADLAASVTVGVDNFIAAVEKAVNGAQDAGAKVGDELGLGVATDIAKSKDVSADGDGLAQAYSYYTATTFDKDGKITSCLIDASQGNINFDATGTVTTDLTVAPQSKQELKEGYGMKKASGIGKEWYEQANSFAAYVIGKTVDDVKGIALAEGKPSDADLAASVTVHVNSFQTVIEKAKANSAK